MPIIRSLKPRQGYPMISFKQRHFKKRDVCNASSLVRSLRIKLPWHWRAGVRARPEGWPLHHQSIMHLSWKSPSASAISALLEFHGACKWLSIWNLIFWYYILGFYCAKNKTTMESMSCKKVGRYGIDRYALYCWQMKFFLTREVDWRSKMSIMPVLFWGRR